MSSGRGRGTRLPRGHPNYHRQLARIRTWYQTRHRQLPEPGPESEIDFDDVPLTEEELRMLNEWDEEHRATAENTEASTDNREDVSHLVTPQPSTSRQGQITDHFQKTKGDTSEPEKKRQRTTEPAQPTMADMSMDFVDGGSGGGGSGGGGGPAVEHEHKFGQACKPYTKHYKKSFLVNITNGKEHLHLVHTPAAAGAPNIIDWNEGWQILPWGDIKAYMQPMDFYEVSMARKYRIKSTKVTLEGIVPFQVDLAGAANSTTATFNNRVNLHLYVDDGELLPTSELTPLGSRHNAEFTMPWGEGNIGKLSSPNIRFHGAAPPNAFRYSCDNGFDAAEPQRYFSLYNTGQVQSYYPGQKFSKTWVNGNTQWIGRSTNDFASRAYSVAGQPAADVDYIINKQTQGSYQGGFGPTYAQEVKQVPPVLTLAGGKTAYGEYMDTGLPVKLENMPYIWVRVEPYPNLGDGGGLINIYCQAHVHYEMEVEIWPLEKPATYVPIITNVVEVQGSVGGFQNQIYRDSRLGITDNLMHRRTGPRDNTVVYT